MILVYLYPLSVNVVGVEVPHADLQLIRDYMTYKTMDIFNKAQLGQAFLVRHFFVFRRDASNEWKFAMTHFKDSAVMCWPMQRKQIPCTKVDYFEPIMPIQDVELMSVFDLKFSARAVVFRSWAYQRRKFGEKMNTLKPGIRMFASTEELPLFSLMCEKAFWKMTRTAIDYYATAKGAKFNKSDDDFAVLYDVIKSTMKTSEDATMKKMQPRLTQTELDEHFGKHIHEIDEAVDVLEESDLHIYEAEKTDQVNREVKTAAFRKDFAEKREKLVKAKKIKDVVVMGGVWLNI